MAQQNDFPSQATVRSVVAMVNPTYTSFRIEPLAGSYSNHTHLVNIELADGSVRRIVLRRYNEANGDCIGKARREFHALKLLQSQGFPAPKPLYLDDRGDLLGSPGIVTAYVPGRQIEVGAAPGEWRDQIDGVARMLARIHRIPFEESTQRELMDGNVEVAWFLKAETVPNFMSRDPDGATVWIAVAELLPHRQKVRPALLHLDYWSGNILWDEGQISAVVDWEEAAFGDSAIDVAYCRMELYLEGLADAAERFLQVYEEETGQEVANLGVWELAAAARPMIDPADWFTRPLMEDRFRRFIAEARVRATAE